MTWEERKERMPTLSQKNLPQRNVCTVTLSTIKNSVGGKVLGGVGMRLHNIFSFERAKCEMPVADPAMKIILWTEKRGSFTDI